jgi:hypothetical protein
MVEFRKSNTTPSTPVLPEIGPTGESQDRGVIFSVVNVWVSVV